MAATRSPQGAATPKKLRNIVLVTIDTLRADHLHCYGYERKTSPSIDRLAEHGVLFEQATTQWPKTSPSIASLLSSTFGSTSGVMWRTFDRKVPLAYELLPELLHAAGYQTIAVVANPALAPKFQFDQGFDRFVEVTHAQPGEVVTKQAIDLMRERDPARPWFLWVHYIDPHAPYVPPARASEPFLRDDVYSNDLRPSVALDPELGDAGMDEKRRVNDIGVIPAYAYLKGRDHVRDYVAQYDGEIRHLDDAVGALFDELGESGPRGVAVKDRAILVLTADHGESLGDHNYYFEHGRFPYDDCVRVPLIIVHPEWKPARIAAPVGLIDLAPTLLSLVGVTAGKQFEGCSLREWIESGAPEADARSVVTESGYEVRFDVSLRQGKWKLIKFGSQKVASLLSGQPYELYDVIADPGETNNVVNDEPEVFERLRKDLDAYVDVAYRRKPPAQDGEEFAPSPEEQKLIDELGYAKDKQREETKDE